jgi:type IV pilus assembly protein PilE
MLLALIRLRRAVRPQHGFTLVELMITLVIVAVLAAIALPSYQSSVRKARRSDAFDAAVGVQQTQERFRSNNTGYAATLTAINQPATSSGGYYGLTLSGVSGTGYTLTLAAVTGKSQASDTGCTSMTVVVTNGSPAYAPATCWSR